MNTYSPKLDADDIHILSVSRTRHEIPGPASSVLLGKQQDRESNAISYPRRLPIAVASARGAYVTDADGNQFIDCLTGAGVLSLGHCHPELTEAAKRQLDIFTHGLDLPSPVRDRFRDAQLSMLPDDIRDDMCVHFCGPTGSDAVEAALKLAKIYTGGTDIISFQGAYHGSSHATLSITGLRGPKSRLTNLMPGVQFFPYSSCSDCPIGLCRESCDVNCATVLTHALRDPNSGLGRPAAVILELVQGEGGVNPADPLFVRKIREVTRQLDIPLIVDEVQTGCGRTGTWFAFEQYDIRPDIIVASKALSGIGSPVALLFFDKRLNVWEPGSHIGTFRGNQIAFASGLAAIEVIRRDNVLENVRSIGQRMKVALQHLASQYPVISNVRGLGLMLGIEIHHPSSGERSQELARMIQARALREGLIVEVGGRDDSVVRMLPPLNISSEIADDILCRLTAAIAFVTGALQAKVAAA
jgi:diaminobutyrate-2-oxoglutarate transaminase